MNETPRFPEWHLDHTPGPVRDWLLPVRGAAWLVGVASAFALMLTIHAHPWPSVLLKVPLEIALLLVACAAYARLSYQTSDRYAVVLGRRGLREVFRFSQRSYPWDSVQRVEMDDDGASIVTSRGVIEVGPFVRNGRWLAARVAAIIGQSLPDQPAEATVEPEQVAAWLGVHRGEKVRARGLQRVGTRGGLMLPGCLGALLGQFLLDDVLRDPHATAVFFLIVLPLCVVLAILRRGGVIEATPDRLRLQWGAKRRDLAWRDVFAVRYDTPAQERAAWTISTSAGDFTLPEKARGAERIVAAIKQALEARHAGEVLPRMSDVSDAAISPVTVSTSPDRGLSPAEGNPPDAP